MGKTNVSDECRHRAQHSPENQDRLIITSQRPNVNLPSSLPTRSTPTRSAYSTPFLTKRTFLTRPAFSVKPETTSLSLRTKSSVAMGSLSTSRCPGFRGSGGAFRCPVLTVQASAWRTACRPQAQVYKLPAIPRCNSLLRNRPVAQVWERRPRSFERYLVPGPV